MSDLKAEWRRVRFGDMVASAGATRKARGWTASETGVDRYIGLEHLDSNSLRIRRWGSPDGVGANSDLRHFEPGDVILARRGIELRKVGVAEFRGVASGHALVFRANPEVVLPEFLPFFMQSDAFMNRADRFSVGSLSRTVNLSALTREEFLLPPLEEQNSMIAVLTAARAVAEAAVGGVSAHRALEAAFVDKVVQEDLEMMRPVEQLVAEGFLESPQDGNHGEKHPKARDFVDTGVPFLMAADIRAGRVDLVGCKFIPKRLADSLRIGFAREGDVLLTHKGTVGESAIVPPVGQEYVMLTPQVTYYRPNTARLLSDYLRLVFRSSFFQQQLRAHERQSTRSYVGITTQRRLRITCPSLQRQHDVVNALREMSKAGKALEIRSRTSTQLLVGLRERFVTGPR